MKRYWLFLYDEFCQFGGINDFHSDYDTHDLALEYILYKHNLEDTVVCYHIFDSETKKIVGCNSKPNHDVMYKVNQFNPTNPQLQQFYNVGNNFNSKSF